MTHTAAAAQKRHRGRSNILIRRQGVILNVRTRRGVPFT